MTFSFGKTKLGKVAYDVWLLSEAGTDFATWTKVGICGAEPTLKDAKGDTIKTNDGIDNVIGRNQTADFIVYEVTSANRTAMIGLINKNTSVVFAKKGGAVPSGTTLTAPAGGWLLINVNIFPETVITGNAQNQIACSGMVEVGPSDTANFTGTD